MSHSHLPLQHLLKKIETTGPRPRRDVRPPWLTELIDEVAELFEPFTDVGRVGFECSLANARWDVSMYLGKTESVGGKDDGEVQHVDFQFDILKVQQQFSRIDSLRWNAFPGGREEAESTECSFVSIDGLRGENALRLRIFCTPPVQAGPGLRHHSDGTWEPV